MLCLPRCWHLKPLDIANAWLPHSCTPPTSASHQHAHCTPSTDPSGPCSLLQASRECCGAYCGPLNWWCASRASSTSATVAGAHVARTARPAPMLNVRLKWSRFLALGSQVASMRTVGVVHLTLTGLSSGPLGADPVAAMSLMVRLMDCMARMKSSTSACVRDTSHASPPTRPPNWDMPAASSSALFMPSTQPSPVSSVPREPAAALPCTVFLSRRTQPFSSQYRVWVLPSSVLSSILDTGLGAVLTLPPVLLSPSTKFSSSALS
mmetsp:Transcript_3968/g.9862  ORF Transcript_3968/g.9862 Transcript_3968/m.9862 type:complete len:265 (-) Transcript_3968:209-1003(-)